MIIALPEQFLNYRPRKVVEVFTENFKKRHQVECTSALHHNAERTNYHIYLIFSESGLEETYFGLLFLTPENLESRWIYYEAGSLSKGKNDSHVIPMLYQLEAGKLQEPLSAFHAMSLEKHDMLKVVKTINKKMAEVTEESLLEEIFENWWEKWEAEADKFPADIKEIEESIKLTDAPQMNIQEQIEEVLTRLRRQDGKEGVSKIPRLNEMDNDIFKMQELEDFSNVIREADFLDSEQKRTVITKM